MVLISIHDENGVVYYINTELLRRARERDLRAQIDAVDEQLKNAQEDLMVVKTTEMALAGLQRVLAEMRGIAVDAANNPDADRAALTKQLESCKLEIDAIVEAATYKGVNLLDGSMGSIHSVIAAVNAALDGKH